MLSTNGQARWMLAFLALALGLALAAPLSPVRAATPGVAYVATGLLNLRAGPGTTHAVVAQLGDGQAVTLLGRNFDGTWLEARTPAGQTGWLSTRYLVTETAINDLAVTDGSTTLARGYAINLIALREGPGLSFAQLRYLPRNGEVRLMGRNLNGRWVWVRLPDGAEGWVEARALKTSVPVDGLALSDDRFPGSPPPAVIVNWRGEYFSNRDLAGSPALVRDDAFLDFNWGAGAPAPGLPADDFSARWTRTLTLEGGRYRFRAAADDGVRVFVDGSLVIDGWQEARLRELTADVVLAAGAHSVRVDYFERGGEAAARLSWERLDSFPDWRADYFANGTLSGGPTVTRNDVTLDFNWGLGAPDSRLPADGFSARWQRSLELEAATYRFRLAVDDGARLWVDDRLIIDEWRGGGVREATGEVALAAGTHRLRVEYFEATLDARLRLTWEKSGPPVYTDWKGEYFANPDLNGAPILTRNDVRLDFNWGAAPPAAKVPADLYSVRWSRTLNFEAGSYRFYAEADDGVRVLIDGQPVINQWHESDGGQYFADLTLAPGQHAVVVEYYERYHGALLHVWWTGP